MTSSEKAVSSLSVGLVNKGENPCLFSTSRRGNVDVTGRPEATSIRQRESKGEKRSYRPEIARHKYKVL